MVANRIRIYVCIFAIMALVAASVSVSALTTGFENGVGKNAEAIGSDIAGLSFCAVNATTLQPSGNDVLYADIDSGWYSVTSDREEEPNEFEDGEYFMSGSVAAYITELNEKAKISFTVSTASFFKVGYCSQYFDDGADPPSEIKFTVTAYDSEGNILDVAQGSANTKSQGGTGLDYLTVEDEGGEIAYVIVGCPGGYWLIDNIETDALSCVPPVADPGGPYKICKGGELQLNGSASGGESPYTYLWGGTDAAKLSATNVANPTFDTSVAGTFSVTLTVTGDDDCESDPVQVDVTVNEPPTATASNNGPVCVGGTLSLTGGPANMSSYSWTGPNDFISSDQSPTVSNSATTAMAGQYTLTVTDGNGCKGSASTTVTVNTAASITTQPDDDAVCSGDEATFTVVATGTAPLSYQWYDGDDNEIDGATDSSYKTGVAGSYYCKVTNDCGSDTSDTVTLTVNTAPSITTQPDDDAVCSGDEATFTVVATGTAPLSYQWYDGDDNEIDGATDSSYKTGVAGSYYCKVTNDCGSDTSETVTLTVNTAPSITTQPDDDAVCSGDEATFTVVATGTAPLSYQWYDGDDNEIDGATDSSYKTGVAGSYYCKVTNDCGSDTSDTVTLTVNTAPSITTQPDDDAVCSGDEATFTVVATGTAPLSYQWYDGDDNEIDGATDSSYKTGVAGSYYCKVTNDCGSDTSDTVTLTVNTAPSITTQPDDDAVCSGDEATFTVVATGTAPLSYQWYDGDDNEIDGATDSSYKTGVAGSYYCKVTNDCGSDTSDTVTLTVNTAPSITTQPDDDAVCSGDEATFTVVATGTAPLSYQWYDGDDNEIDGATDSSYKTGVAGSYYCKVTNDCGSDTSDTVTLTVNTAPSITTQPDDDAVCSGDEATFTVVATGTAPLSYQWYDGDDNEIDGATDSSYKTGVAGSYYCKVTNDCGSDTSDTVTLTVNTAPSITTQPDDDAVCSGDEATFTVVATGTAPLSYQWYDGDDNEIDGATDSSYKTGVAGSYYCKVTNDCGSDTSDTVTLTVNTAPSITTQPDDDAVCSGDEATFTVVATGTAPLSYQWYDGDDNEIDGATDSSYKTGVAGSYYCKVTNDCGSDTSDTVTLTVNTAPSITTQPDDDAVCSGDEATFTVVATGTAPLSYQWYDGDDNEIDGATDSSYKTGVAGSYYCKVTNDCGSDTSETVTLTVNTAPSITTQPDDDAVCSGDEATFTVVATGTAPLSYQWYDGDDNEIDGATDSSYKTGVAGSYYCKVTNDCGSDTSDTVTLTVNTAASITTQPDDDAVCSGDEATFTVVATGTAPLSYQWYDGDDNEIDGATDSSYKTGVAGSYYCKVTNDCGSDTSDTVTLTVNTAPSITTQPDDDAVCSGDEATFTVVATGTAPLSYQWYDGDDNEIEGATDSSYKTGVAGSYYCKVTNDCGSDTSDTVTLTVNTAPSITTQPDDDAVCSGDEATFTVVATGTAPLSYQWYDGDDNEIEGATDSSYKTGVAGSYYCKVTNDCGSDTSDTVTLTVNTAPSITTQPDDDAVCSGDEATFTVVATGTAPLSYQWYDGDDNEIDGATDSSYKTGVAGSYYCKVTNDCGSDTSDTVTLTVNTAPSITTQPSDQSTCEGQNAIFTVEASGSGSLSYQWKISTDDGENWLDIDDANSSSYTTPSVTMADDGNLYKCVVSNACGNVTSDAAKLTVQTSLLVLKDASDADTIYVKPSSEFDIELWQESMCKAAAGYQAFLAYDSDMLSITKNDVEITEDPYSMHIRKNVNGKNIDLAAGIYPVTQSACDEDSLLATLTFTAGQTEGTTQVSFRENLPPTRFSDLGGKVINALQIDGPTIVIDGTPPQVSIAADPSSWTKGDDVELTFSASDDYLDYYEISVNNSVVTPTPSSPYECDISGLESGEYSATITAYDKAGNKASDEATIYIDRTKPVISITSAKQSNVELIGGADAGLGVIDIYVSASDAHSGLASAPSVTVTPDGSSAENATYVDVDEGVYHYKWTVTASTPNGVAKINASVSDNVGNSENASEQSFNISKSRAVIEVKLLGVKEDVTREIKFVIGDGGTSDVITFVEDVDFVYDSQIDEENSIGQATLDDIPVDTTWTEISAKDEQHTLRHKVELDVDQNLEYTASLELIGGDATNDNLIDILDFGVFFGMWGVYPEASTWPVLDADFSCDGLVWSEDFSFIDVYFLTFGDDEPAGPEQDGFMSFNSMSAEDSGPRAAVSVTELAGFIGMEAALRADINGDGVVDKTDIKRFIAGLME